MPDFSSHRGHNWQCFPDGTRATNIVVLRTVEPSPVQKDHTYEVEYECCGMRAQVSHFRILKRINSKAVMCPRCAPIYSARSRSAKISAARKLKIIIPEPEYDIVPPTWPVPNFNKKYLRNLK